MAVRYRQTMYRQAIIGAGVVGLTLAEALSQRFPGETMLLLEQGSVAAQGASAVPVALLNPYRGRSARAQPRDLAGLQQMHRLAASLDAQGLPSGMHFSGVLRIASNRKQAKTWRSRPGLQPLAPCDLPAMYHAPYEGFLAAQGGWLEPHRLLASLKQVVQQRGVHIHTQCRLHAVLEQTGGYRLESSQGSYEAEQVWLCIGADSLPTLPAPAYAQAHTLALQRLAGEVLRLQAPNHDSHAMPYALAGAIYAAATPEAVYVGGNHRDAQQDDPSAAAQLHKAAAWFLPPLQHYQCKQVWTGVRAKTADNAPRVLELQPGLVFVGAMAGRGFLVAAHVAAQLAAQLSHGGRLPPEGMPTSLIDDPVIDDPAINNRD